MIWAERAGECDVARLAAALQERARRRGARAPRSPLSRGARGPAAPQVGSVDLEAAPAAVARQAAHVAAVLARDLAHEREAEPDAARRARSRRRAGRTARRSARARLPARPGRGRRRVAARRRRPRFPTATSIGVPPPWRRAFSSRLRTSRRSSRGSPCTDAGSPSSARIDARALLRGEREQVDVLARVERRDRHRAGSRAGSRRSARRARRCRARARAQLRASRPPPSSSIAMRMRASGERSSCEAFASRLRCASTSASIRSAARLKLRARSATSSRPSTGTRAARSPAPSASTLRLQALEPARDATHDRIRADRDGEREQPEREQQPADGANGRDRAAAAGREPPAVRQLERPDAAAMPRASCERVAARRAAPAARGPTCAIARAVGREERDVDLTAGGELLERRLLRRARRVRRRQRARAISAASAYACGGGATVHEHAPQPAGQRSRRRSGSRRP